MISRLVQGLIQRRYWLLGLALVLALVSYRPAQRLQFDRSIENMFAPGDPLLAPFQQLKRTFAGNEIVLAVYQDDKLLDPGGAGLARLASVSARMKSVEGVRDVLSLAEVNALLEKLPGNFSIFRRARTQAAILDPDSDASRSFRDLFAGYTHSADGKVAALVVMLIPQNETTVPRRKTIDDLRQAVEDLPDGLAPGMLAGEPVMITDGFRYLEEDGQRLGWWTTALLALVIVICFRSLRWVVIAVAVVQWTLIVTQATLAWSGVRLSMVSSMLSAILTVVGIATVVHIIVVLREQFSAGLTDADHPLKQPANASPALQALQRAGILLAIPIFWSCLTDSVGFASLLSARLGPVQDFGLMSALGVLLVLAAVTLIIPGFALVGPVEDRPQRMWGEARMEAQLARAIAWVDRHPAPLLLAFAAASLVALVGSLRMDVETDFTKNFRPNSPVVRSYQFVETYLGGAGVWDVVLPAPEVITEEYLDQVLALEKSLRAITITDTATGKQRPGLTKVISIADVDQAAQASRAAALLPARTRLSAMHAALPTFVSALLTQQPDEHGQRYLRIMLRASERQPAHEKNQLISQVQQLAQAAFPAGQNAPAAEVTGFFVLLTHLIDSMLADQWITFGVSTVGITLMLLVALRSAKLAVIAQIPNLFPILWTLGFMGWLGMKMNMGAAMIAAVSLGLSVDTSIHYILEYQAARRHGLNCMQALYRAQQGVGRALVFSTLALVAGFSVLATSQFIPTVYFGILVSLAMLGGLLGNLLILPLLIRLTTRD